MAKLLTEQELQEIRWVNTDWEQGEHLFNHIEALEAECAAQRQLIEEIQWTGGGIIFSDDGPVHKTCPKCLLTNTFREHDTDCPISQALSGTAGQALLDRLGQLRAEVGQLEDQVGDWQRATLLDDGSGDPGGITPAHLEAEITHLRAMALAAPRWLPVSEELPPSDEKVPVMCNYFEDMKDGHYLDAVTIRDLHAAQQGRITHWLKGMPLLPQEEVSNDLPVLSG